MALYKYLDIKNCEDWHLTSWQVSLNCQHEYLCGLWSFILYGSRKKEKTQRGAKTGVGKQTDRALFGRHMEERILPVQTLLCGNKAQLLQVPQTSKGVSKKTTIEV